MKKTFISLIVILFLMVLISTFMWFQVEKYHDTHTWATAEFETGWINENGEQIRTSDSMEFLKGDKIEFQIVLFSVEDISHDGTIVIGLNSDEFSDENGNEITTDTIHLNETKTYYKGSKDNYFSVTVISNRYQ